MKKNNYLKLLFIISFLLHFEQHLNATILVDTIRFQKFSKEKELNFSEYLKLEDGYIRQLFLMDSSIVLLDLMAKSNFFFSQYSLADKKLTKSFIQRGTKFGEAMNGFTGGVYNNETFWFHDISLSRIVTATPAGNFSSDPVKLNQFTLSNFYHTVQIKDATILYGEGATHAKYKIQELNLINNNETNLFDVYNRIPASIPYYAWKNAHEAFLYSKPTKDKLVLAYQFTDKVEILDLKTNKSRMISGPLSVEPNFTPRVREGRDEAVIDDDAIVTFINGCMTDKFIYLLYSGNLRPASNSANYIFVYDWNGNPIEKINCKKEISAFVVSADDKDIYVFEPSSQSVLQSSLIGLRK
jgi:hypothetical protein